MQYSSEVIYEQKDSYLFVVYLTLNLLMTTIFAPPSNASKWQMGFNSAFEGLTTLYFLLNKANIVHSFS
jgi:hypothetical protein